MKESEIRLLFLRIGNCYSGFAYDDFKVEEWRLLLEDVPFDRASKNLATYTINPANTFPPHPGVLAAIPIQQSCGPAIPNAEETRIMLETRDEEYSKKAIPMPDHVKEVVKRLAKSNVNE